jgi:hypothetical protein
MRHAHRLRCEDRIRVTALVLVGTLVAIGCGGSTTGLEDDGGTPGVVTALEVEQGAEQSARPEQAMPDSVVGRATDDAGTPVEGQLVHFEVPAGAEAGTFDVGSLLTNGQGRVFNELRAGTRAWTARVAAGEDSAYTARLVASRDGRPDEILEFTFAVEPGPAEFADLSHGSWSIAEDPFVGRMEAPGGLAPDSLGNPALWRFLVGDGLLGVETTRPGTPEARTLIVDDSAAFSALEGDTTFYSNGQVRMVEATGPTICIETEAHGAAESGRTRIQKRFDLGVTPSDSTAEIAVRVDVPTDQQFGLSPVCPS